MFEIGPIISSILAGRNTSPMRRSEPTDSTTGRGLRLVSALPLFYQPLPKIGYCLFSLPPALSKADICLTTLTRYLFALPTTALSEAGICLCSLTRYLFVLPTTALSEAGICLCSLTRYLFVLPTTAMSEAGICLCSLPPVPSKADNWLCSLSPCLRPISVRRPTAVRW